MQDLAGNGIEIELLPLGRQTEFNVATFYQVSQLAIVHILAVVTGQFGIHVHTPCTVVRLFCGIYQVMPRVCVCVCVFVVVKTVKC